MIFTETKLVRCTRGAVLDIVVDLRPESPACLKRIAVELVEGRKSKRDIAQNEVITYDDVELPPNRLAGTLRAEQWAHFTRAKSTARGKETCRQKLCAAGTS